MTQPAKKPPTSPPPWDISDGESTPINLEVRFRTGDGCFFPYAYLVYCRYDRGGTIELHFSTWVLRIEGRNLGELYGALNKHTASAVQEGDHEESTSETAPFISQLTVAEADD